jgi:hypothetical protein
MNAILRGVLVTLCVAALAFAVGYSLGFANGKETMNRVYRFEIKQLKEAQWKIYFPTT